MVENYWLPKKLCANVINLFLEKIKISTFAKTTRIGEIRSNKQVQSIFAWKLPSIALHFNAAGPPSLLRFLVWQKSRFLSKIFITLLPVDEFFHKNDAGLCLIIITKMYYYPSTTIFVLPTWLWQWIECFNI